MVKMVKMACNTGDSGSTPLVRKISWRREWLPNPVFLPGKSHGQRSLVGYICKPGVAKSQTQLNDYHR